MSTCARDHDILLCIDSIIACALYEDLKFYLLATAKVEILYLKDLPYLSSI